MNVINSGDYYWGEGKCETRENAYNIAISDLTRKISVFVQTELESRTTEQDGELSEKVEIIISTYTPIRELQNVDEISYHTSESSQYFLYLHKNEVDKLFEQRKDEIRSKFLAGENNKRDNNLARALQRFYECLILMNSVPGSIDYDGEDLRELVNSRIEKILDNIKVSYLSDDIRGSIREVRISFEYNGMPVRLLDFDYWDGNDWNRGLARSGKAASLLRGAAREFEELEIRFRYSYPEFEGNDSSYKALKPHFDFRFSNYNTRRIPLISTDSTDHSPESFQIIIHNEMPKDVGYRIEQEIYTFLNVLSDRSLFPYEEIYRHDLFLTNKMRDFFRFNHPRLFANQIEVEINQTWDGWEIRSIPVVCSYPSLSAHKTDFIVLDFDQKGKLSDINFELFNDLYEKLVKREELPYERALQYQVILKFLERYRTTFLTRDLDTLEQIFADNAKIIVGRVIESSRTNRDYELDESNIKVEYLKMNKQEYIKRQRDIFRNQRDIHLAFSELDIIKKDRFTDIYGISMRQEYSSSTYSDNGYLFLLVDFIDENPTIYVRSWQPNVWSEEQKINLSSFIFPS